MQHIPAIRIVIVSFSTLLEAPSVDFTTSKNLRAGCFVGRNHMFTVLPSRWNKKLNFGWNKIHRYRGDEPFLSPSFPGTGHPGQPSPFDHGALCGFQGTISTDQNQRAAKGVIVVPDSDLSHRSTMGSIREIPNSLPSCYDNPV